MRSRTLSATLAEAMACPSMPSLFPEVVENKRHEQERQILCLFEEFAETAATRVLCRLQLFQVLEGYERMFVNCVPVIKIAHDQTLDLFPDRDDDL